MPHCVPAGANVCLVAAPVFFCVILAIIQALVNVIFSTNGACTQLCVSRCTRPSHTCVQPMTCGTRAIAQTPATPPPTCTPRTHLMHPCPAAAAESFRCGCRCTQCCPEWAFKGVKGNYTADGKGVITITADPASFSVTFSNSTATPRGLQVGSTQ